MSDRDPYFIHDQERGTWQLLSGVGNPLTAPRICGCSSPEGEEWRAAVLAKTGRKTARVRCSGAWIGRVDERGEFRYLSGPTGEGGAA